MDNRANDRFRVSTDLPKKSRFAMKYFIFLIVLAIITSICIYFTIHQIDEQNQENNTSTSNTVVKEQAKKNSKDVKYVINSYSETYDDNPINITIFNDIDGKVYTDQSFNYDYEKRVEYLQIDGLRDRSIQNKINEKLKQVPYSFQENNVNSVVTANFSNILSVHIYNTERIETLNIDLATGKDIKFEDLFVSSATINAYLVDALYETLAWSNLSFDSYSDSWNDMSKIDTSEYEDKFIMLINNYNKSKENLKYNITPKSITIYNLLDNKIIDTENVENIGIKIDLTKYMQEITMYKRFLTNIKIYEDESIGIKDTIVFTSDTWEKEYLIRLNYGKIQNNIFLEEVMMKPVNAGDEIKHTIDYVKKLSEENKAKLINQNKKDKGVFFQRVYNIWYNQEDNYFVINENTYQATCSLDYFKNDAFLDFITLNKKEYDDVNLKGFEVYFSDDFPNLTILPSKNKQYYISIDGEFLGNTEEEAKESLQANEITEEVNQSEENNNTLVNEIVEENIIVRNNEIVHKNEIVQNQINTQTNNIIN